MHKQTGMNSTIISLLLTVDAMRVPATTLAFPQW